MHSIKLKTNTGILLLGFFIITLITGLVLHLKKHGILIEPRAVIKTVHTISGFTMAAFVTWHVRMFRQPFLHHLAARKSSGIISLIMIFCILGATATGLIKLIVPIKIHGLGLWHYWTGLLMSVAITLHLCKGLPLLIRMIQAQRHNH